MIRLLASVFLPPESRATRLEASKLVVTAMDTEVSDQNTQSTDSDPAMELRDFVAKLMQSPDLESVASEIDGKI